MKTKSDPRHQLRVAAVKKLFEYQLRPNTRFGKTALASQIAQKRRQIDNLIGKNAPAWPLQQILPIDLAILRLAIFELVFKEKKAPYKVVIDEAVEIAKQYGDTASASFVNGVLGSIIKSQKAQSPNL